MYPGVHLATMPLNFPLHTTVVYKNIRGHKVSLDVFRPIIRAIPDDVSQCHVPALVYFHGGGLTVGTRKSWFPYWLHSELLTTSQRIRNRAHICTLIGRTVESGIAFLSVDYQLMPPGTGHDLVSDIRDLFTFINGDDATFQARVENTGKEVFWNIDTNAVAVAGPSAGGLCAYIAAGIIQPKPKALLSLYGMGGDLMVG